MSNISNSTQLKQSIALLEAKQAAHYKELKLQFNETFESLKPINLIKKTIKDLTKAPDFKEDLINSSIGLGVGYLTKKIAFGTTHNPIKQIIGTLMQIGVTSLVSKNGDPIKTGLNTLLHLVLKKKKQDTPNESK